MPAGRPIGSKNSNVKYIGRKENGVYMYNTYCEMCNVETSNMSMHAKSKGHKRNAVVFNNSLSVAEKCSRLSMLV